MGPARLTYPATLYAALHRGNAGDLAFYRTVCEAANSVLELGCGYGRVLAALDDVVEQRWGLDQHEGLLALAAARAGGSHLVRADMRAFEVSQRFDRILIPYNGLYCLLTDEDIQACLAAVKRHLNPQGQLIFDVYPYDGPPTDEELESMREPVPIVEINDEDVQCVVYESVEFDAASECAEVTYRYVPKDGTAPVDASIAQRALDEQAIATHLARAGFQIERWFDGFAVTAQEDAANIDDTDQWVIVAVEV